jgi:tRNA threonylcarbamoyl adenosine modification protein YjeE
MEITGHEAMKAEAARFISTITERSNSATVIALAGDLGSGKTTFAQGIAQALGVEENVTSPTFVIEKIYELENQRWQHLIHIDAYRLKDAHELEAIGWNEIINDPSNLIVIEWPENVATIMPSRTMRISLTGTGDSREIIYG